MTTEGASPAFRLGDGSGSLSLCSAFEAGQPLKDLLPGFLGNGVGGAVRCGRGSKGTDRSSNRCWVFCSCGRKSAQEITLSVQSRDQWWAAKRLSAGFSGDKKAQLIDFADSYGVNLWRRPTSGSLRDATEPGLATAVQPGSGAPASLCTEALNSRPRSTFRVIPRTGGT